MLYLSEKKRIKVTVPDVLAYMGRYPCYEELPLDSAIVTAAAAIQDIPELHDRLIAGSALFLQVPLITNDPVIQASKSVKTVW